VPHVSRQDYSLLDISDDGFVRRPACATGAAQARWHAAHPRAFRRCQISLMDDAGNTKDDLKLPADDEIANAVRHEALNSRTCATHLTSRKIKSGFDAGSELVVTVLKSMGEEQVHAVKLGA